MEPDEVDELEVVESMEPDELEVVEPASESLDVDDSDLFDDEPLRGARSRQTGGVRAPRRRGAKRQASEGRSPEILRRLVSPKVILPVFGVGLGILMLFAVYRFTRREQQNLPSVRRTQQHELFQVDVPFNVTERINDRINSGSQAHWTEQISTTDSMEFRCSAVRWKNSVAGGMDAAEIYQSLRNQWVVPFGKIESEQEIVLSGVTGREFQCRSSEREMALRAFVNRIGLVVVKVSNRDGKEFNSQQRDEFFESLRLSDEFARGAPAVIARGRSLEATKSVVIRPVTPPPNFDAPKRPGDENVPDKPIEPEIVASVETGFGSAPRTTRGFTAPTGTDDKVIRTADKVLPPLTSAAWTGAVEVLPAPKPEWRVPALTAQESLPSAPALVMELNDRNFRGAVLTSTRQLALLTEPRESSQSKPAAGKKSDSAATLELYNIGDGGPKKASTSPARPNRQITIPFSCQLLDVSPSGKFALVRSGRPTNDRDSARLATRLDVIDLQSGQHRVGFRPFADFSQDIPVIQSAFVDDDHLLTLTGSGNLRYGAVLALWELSQCRAVYLIQGISTRTLSPNRRLLGISRVTDSLRERRMAATAEPTGLFVLDALTGATLGHLPGNAVTHAVFHPREPRLFALAQNESLDVAIEWDLKSGTVRREFPLPGESWQYHLASVPLRGLGRSMADDRERTIAWTAPEQLLINNRTVLDLKRETYSANVQFSEIALLPQNNDPRVWFLSEIDTRRHLWSVGVSELPDTKMRETIELAMPKPEMLLYPKATLSLSFQLPALPGDIAAEVEKRIHDQLEQLEITVREGAETTLVVSAKEEPLPVFNDPFPRWPSFRTSSEPSNQPRTRIACKFQFLRGGKVDMEFDAGSHYGMQLVSMKHNDETLRRGSQNVKNRLFEGRLPPYIFSKEWSKGLTNWHINSRGVQQQLNVGGFP